MGSFIDLTGQTFARLTVTGRSAVRRSTGALWDCSCSCGGVALVDSLKLRTGHTTSCGCHRREMLLNLTHGQSKVGSRTYRTWKEMRQRCMNPNSDKWQWYGGRGISITPAWDTFEAFRADMGERPEGKTLDRIDSDGNYEKGNCRWATSKEQATTNRGVKRKGSIAPNKMPEGMVEIFSDLRKQGHSLVQISKVTGYHPSTISAKLCALLRGA